MTISISGQEWGGSDKNNVENVCVLGICVSFELHFALVDGWEFFCLWIPSTSHSRRPSIGIAHIISNCTINKSPAQIKATSETILPKFLSNNRMVPMNWSSGVSSRVVRPPAPQGRVQGVGLVYGVT